VTAGSGRHSWDDEQLAFRITLRDVYDTVREVSTKVDVVTNSHAIMDAELRRLMAENADHEHRLRNVERRQWPLPTLAIVVSALALVATLVINLSKGS